MRHFLSSEKERIYMQWDTLTKSWKPISQDESRNIKICVSCLAPGVSLRTKWQLTGKHFCKRPCLIWWEKTSCSSCCSLVNYRHQGATRCKLEQSQQSWWLLKQIFCRQILFQLQFLDLDWTIFESRSQSEVELSCLLLFICLHFDPMLNVNHGSRSDIIKPALAVSEQGKGREMYAFFVVTKDLIAFVFQYWCFSSVSSFEWFLFFWNM